jgi:hypothetical protein
MYSVVNYTIYNYKNYTIYNYKNYTMYNFLMNYTIKAMKKSGGIEPLILNRGTK